MDPFQVVEASGYVPHQWFHYVGGAVMALVAAGMIYAVIKANKPK